MSTTAIREKLAGVVGGLVVLGTLGCLGITLLAGSTLAFVGGGVGYGTSGPVLLAVVVVHVAIGAGVVLYRYR